MDPFEGSVCKPPPTTQDLLRVDSRVMVAAGMRDGLPRNRGERNKKLGIAPRLPGDLSPLRALRWEITKCRRGQNGDPLLGLL
jgi:hypothetical protein